MKIALFSRGIGSGRAVRLAVAGCALLAVGATGTPAPTADAPDPLLASGTQVRPAGGAPEVPEVSALSWVVADARSGDVLAAHDAHRRLPPASTLKTLFALALLPRVPEGRHRATDAELADVGEGSSLVGVEAGRAYSVDDLWRGVFLSSGNDAVHVLSAMAGGTRAAVARMQDTARKLGARDTRVVSPDGYDAPGQVSSAYDLAVFGRTGLRDPRFAEYCRTAFAEFPGRKGAYDIHNTNRLLTGAQGVERYSGAIGVKNGYTSKAGHTLVAAARRGGRTLVVTVLNPQDGGSATVYEEARSLLDWGFRAAGRVRPVGSLEPPVAAGPPS
ncbi:D-alanyl-D-alanine carboxypeptidase family protein, partial [Streptomyces sp. UH6]|uniref:D-alanyl-D-alanine carboxypeptidase family protein n=1 Tax=Streptomyces sp. UH6 TaxID=2748379 RepID=UPI0015D49FFF